jgi:hypothetical protein
MPEAAAHQLRRSNQMLRKIVIGLVAAASLSAMALVTTEASAKSFGGRGFGRGGAVSGHHFAGGGGFGGRHNFGGVGFGLGLGLGLVAAGVESACHPVATASGHIVSSC